MNIIERTQYSADGGETWALSEENARICAVHGNLAERVGEMRAGYILDSIREHTDALIAALRDMGALSEANDGWTAYRAAFKKGSEQAIEHAVTSEDGIEYNGQRYAVVPVKQHEKEKAALEAVIDVARNGGPIVSASDWCNARGIDWRDN